MLIAPLKQNEEVGSYKSMFNASNWLLLEVPFLTVKLFRKLTGILPLPGIMGK